MKEMRAFTKKMSLHPLGRIIMVGQKAKDKKLRFSKSGNETIEQGYATSYISCKTINKLKNKST
jgi:hypothetical protein